MGDVHLGMFLDGDQAGKRVDLHSVEDIVPDNCWVANLEDQDRDNLQVGAAHPMKADNLVEDNDRVRLEEVDMSSMFGWWVGILRIAGCTGYNLDLVEHLLHLVWWLGGNCSYSRHLRQSIRVEEACSGSNRVHIDRTVVLGVVDWDNRDSFREKDNLQDLGVYSLLVDP